MLSAGIDYHKKYSQVTVLNEAGETVWKGRLPNSLPAFSELRAQLPPEPCRAVFEAGRTWGVMLDLLEQTGFEPVVAHPLRLRAIAEAHIKTDQRDADALALLLNADAIPRIHVPSKDVRGKRHILRQRMWLVRLRTMAKNRVHLILDRNHVETPRLSDLFGRAGQAWLGQLELPDPDGRILRTHLELVAWLSREVRATEAWIEEALGSDRNRELLRTLPGFGKILGALAALEIDTVRRFRSKQRLSAYAGLAPSTYASGGKVRHGRAIPACNHHLRFCFVEAAWTAVRVSPYFSAFHGRLRRRIGTHKAIVAAARKLCEIAWACLSEGRPYREEPYRFRRTTGVRADLGAALEGS